MSFALYITCAVEILVVILRALERRQHVRLPPPPSLDRWHGTGLKCAVLYTPFEATVLTFVG